MSNPYKGLEGYRFWSTSMTEPAPGRIDPVVRSRLIKPEQRVATLGSCFAQHLSRYIRMAGCNYFVAEPEPSGMDPAEAKRRNYGVFSARYGNVYTVRQGLQLFDRAFGAFQPGDRVWRKGGRYVDAFRPRIEPDGFATPDDVEGSAARHLGCVRDVFTQSAWVVFTLGLTEAWRSKADGAVYPVAPGVAGGEYDERRYEFVNFTAAEVRDDLASLVERVRSVNPGVQILLTVSPVPLIATYEKRHVLVSTTYSKAALRVAADEIERRFENVVYFPAYEIITSPAAAGRYYADDLRQVTDLGVSHVMRVFHRHFLVSAGQQILEQAPAVRLSAVNTDADLVCDEEVIQEALLDSGFEQEP